MYDENSERNKKNLFICRKFMKTLDLETQPEISDYAFDKLMGQF